VPLLGFGQFCNTISGGSFEVNQFVCSDFVPNDYYFFDDWFISHGSPSPSGLASDGESGVFLWNQNWTDGINYGEGIYTCFSFNQGKCYELSIDVSPVSGFGIGNIIMKATNNLNELSDCSGLYEPPNPQPADEITQTTLDFFPENTFTTITISYEPSTNYNQLWIYPFSPLPNITAVKFRIDNVIVTQIDCENTSISGCTDSIACNYNVYATNDDGSCEYPGNDCVVFNEENGILEGILNENCECIFNETQMDEIKNPRYLINTLDVLGRGATHQDLKIKIYNDGSVKKEYVIE
jgi:hypothetical protein